MTSRSRLMRWVCAFIGAVTLTTNQAAAQTCGANLQLSYDNVTGFVSGTMTVGTECGGASYSWQVEGTNLRGSGSCAAGCSDAVRFNASCLADGEHGVTFTASCGHTGADGKSCATSQESGRATFSTDQHPRVTAFTVSKTATPALYDVTVGYVFPGSDGWQGRSLTVTGTDGAGQAHTFYSGNGLNPLPHVDDQNGSVSFQVTTNCYPNGNLSLVATATACNGDTARQTTAIAVNHAPQVHMDLTKNPDGSVHAAIHYNFPDTNAPQGRALFLRLLPTAKEAGGTIVSWDGAMGGLPGGAEGTVFSDFALDSRRIVRAQAIACLESEAHDDKGLECCSAGDPPTTVGDPVQLFDGTMTYVEHDPLPDEMGRIFTRVYKSTHSQYDGGLAFGAPWFSAFDAGIALSGSSAIVYTESDDHALFDRLADGTWRQSWPTGHSSRGSLTGSESAGYSYRADGSFIVRSYGGAGSHKLTGLTDLRTQRRAIIEYDAAGKPARVFDEAGRWSCSISIINGRVAQIAVDGRPDIVWNYAYTGGGLLAAVTLAGSPAPWRSYEYERHGILPSFDYLARVRDAAGSVLEEHQYDDSGRALTSLGPSGDITALQYVSDGSPVSKAVVTRADGSVTTYQQTFIGDHEATIRIDGGCSSCGGHDATYAFDRFGHPVRTQDSRGYVVESAYDAAGEKLVSTTRALAPAGCDPATDARRCVMSSAELASATLVATSATRATRLVYDDPNWPDRPTRVEREGSAAEAFVYDATTGETLTHSLIGSGGSVVTATQLYDGMAAAAFDPGGAFNAAWLALPQPRGLKRSIDGPRTDAADVTTYVYYPIASGVPPAWQGRLAAVRNAAGHVIRYEDYDVFGNAQRFVDANGVVTRRTFDALGRLATSTVLAVAGCDVAKDPLCATDLVTTNRYVNVTGPLSATISPGGNAVVYDYDGRGRVVAISRGPSTTDLRERMAWTYDAATQQKASEESLSNAGGVWTVKRREAYAYDAFGRLATITHADGTSVRYTYDGTDDLIAMQDERHTAANTRYAYDAARRLAVVSQTLGSSEARTEYRYDVQDDVTAIVDPNGNVTSYLFDDLGRMLRQDSAVTGATSYNYDAAGNLLSSVDANGATTLRGYDALNREVGAVSSRAGLPVESVSTTYDDPAPGRFGLGRAAVMTDPTGSTAYEYERRGLLAAERKVVDGASYATLFRFDADGNRSSITYPSGRIVDFAFDYGSRPIAASGIVSSASYAPFGPLAAIAFANGTTATMQYDSRYELQENRLAGAAGVIAAYGYAHDAAGNVTQIRDLVDASYNRDFAYDDLNRLVTANGGASLWGAGSYAYDAMGNVRALTLGARSIAFQYAGTTPKLTGASANGSLRDVTYDAAGNEIAAGTSRSAYSARSLLETSDTTAYLYDGRGVRTITHALVDLASVSTNASAVTGGRTVAGTVTLTGPAPAAGAAIALASDNPAAGVPPGITVLPGATTAAFDIATIAVPARTPATISATYGATTRSAQIAIEPAALAAVAIDPISVTGGDPATLTVSLDGQASSQGVVVGLASDRAEAAVPASVTIAGGASAATAPVTTTPVTSPVTASVRATLGAVSRSAALTINAPAVTLSTLALSPATVEGGIPVAGTVSLTAPATSPVVIALTTDDASIAAVPSTVTVAQGAIAGTFTIATTTILIPATVTVTATLGGVSRSASLSVLPPSHLALYRLTIEPPNVAGGSSTSGTLTLTAPASSGGADIALTSSAPSLVVVPSSVKISPGNSSATFGVATVSVSKAETVQVSGAYGGFTQNAPLTVIPASAISIVSLTLVPASVSSGATSTGTIAMSAAAPTGGVLVTIATKQKNVVSVPASVIVPGGASTATFVVTAQVVHTTKTADIAATYASITRSATLTVTQAPAIAPASLGVSAQLAEPLPRRISLYTPELNLLAETESSSAAAPPVAYEYVWFAGRPVAQIDVATSTIHYAFTDHLGTPLLETDAAGAVDWRAEYDPYGGVFALRAGAGRHQPLRLPGQEEGSDAYYNVFRWYRAEWGRYTQRDPIELAGGLNLFAYSAGNPLTFTDRLGLDTIGCDGYLGRRETPCELRCCAEHDKCYADNGCSVGSWPFGRPKCGCDKSGACKSCNFNAVSCVAMCRFGPGAFMHRGDPMFYCGSLHRYVRIPGDFPDRKSAEGVCDTDYSKGCTTPLPARKLAPPWTRSVR